MHFQEADFFITCGIGTRVPQGLISVLCAGAAAKLLANRFLQVPPWLSYTRLLIGTKLYLSSRMSTSSKKSEGLKDSECGKGHLGNRPPVPYVPPTDLLQTKDSSKMLKVKLGIASSERCTSMTRGLVLGGWPIGQYYGVI